jgi:hypothetical protein
VVWEGGANIIGSTGSYMTVPLAPSARLGHMTWADSAGNFWLFGGSSNGNELNDVWQYNPVTKRWALTVSSAPTTAPPGSGSYTSAPYWPGGRHNGMVWVDSSGTLWLFGGLGIDANGNDSYLNDLWSFSISSGQWKLAPASPTVGGDFTGAPPPPNANGVFGASYWPSARGGAATWVDNSGRLWMFAGAYSDQSGNLQLLDDLWVYDPIQKEWARMTQNPPNANGSYGTQGVASSGNVPGARSESLTWKDTAGHLWLFGGGGFDSKPTDAANALSDLWMLAPISAEWIWEGGPQSTLDNGSYGTQGASANTNWPGARGGGMAWTDGSGNVWMFGGRPSLAGTNFFNDLWMLNPTTGLWTWVSGPSGANATAGNYGSSPGIDASTNQPGGRWLSGGWVDTSGHLWMFGGNGYDSAGTLGDLGDLWRF